MKLKGHVWRRCLFLMILTVNVLYSKKLPVIKAAGYNYGILIAGSDGKYVYYDLNGKEGTQKIEKASNATIMIPLKKVCSYMPVLSYSFDWNKKQAVIWNKKNGKKIVVTERSQYVYTYASKHAKPKKVKLAAKTYISKGSGAAMADAKVLKYVFAKTAGYHFYSNDTQAGKKVIHNSLYNSSDLKGIIIYHPYKAVRALPKADAVNYVSEKDLSNIVRVTIPEGYSTAQIADLLVKKGVCQSTQAFLKAVDLVDKKQYSFLEETMECDHRCFLLEGYLYPSTYEFYKNTSPEGVLEKILRNTQKQYSKVYKERAAELGYTLDQVITIASIIEKEVSVLKEQPYIASVLYNRLKSNKKLQCDATIHYVEKYIKPYLSGDKNRFNGYYNTYKCEALPEGPICNPGKSAILAALYPQETSYYYFCSDNAGNYYYADTYEQHLQNIANLSK